MYLFVHLVRGTAITFVGIGVPSVLLAQGVHTLIAGCLLLIGTALFIAMWRWHEARRRFTDFMLLALAPLFIVGSAMLTFGSLCQSVVDDRAACWPLHYKFLKPPEADDLLGRVADIAGLFGLGVALAALFDDRRQKRREATTSEGGRV